MSQPGSASFSSASSGAGDRDHAISLRTRRTPLDQVADPGFVFHEKDRLVARSRRRSRNAGPRLRIPRPAGDRS